MTVNLRSQSTASELLSKGIAKDHVQSAEELRKHIAATYLTLRIGIAALAIALPFALWIFGKFFADLPLQESMSAYYHSADGAMRNVFVGVLFAIGAFLYLYKGYQPLENYALNIAGICLWGVALIPMEWECGNSCQKFSAHGVLAVLFFLSIAYVCVCRASDTLSDMPAGAKVEWYRRAYKIIGYLLIASPIVAILLTYFLQADSEVRSTVFAAEAFGVVTFAGYWMLKSYEISESNVEQAALEGRIVAPKIGLSDALNEAKVKRIG